MTSLRDYLTQTSDNWASIGIPALMERFVLRNGREFKGRPLPRSYKRGTPKECFSNAIHLVHETAPRLTYVEGYVLRENLPILIHHAWAIDSRNRVVDVTLENADATCAYMGVVIPWNEVWRVVKRTKVYGVFDTGRGLNAEWMFERDPPLKALIENLIS